MLYKVLAGVGTFTCIGTLVKLVLGVYPYFRPCTLPRYRQKKDTWALVTGANDGIGKGFAEELAHRGFNVVLHGRNAAALEETKNQLKLKYSDRNFQTVVADASVIGDAGIRQIEDIVKQLPPNLTVLINNVGGYMGKDVTGRFANRTLLETAGSMAVNEGFTTLLTNALLPQLIANQPGLIISCGSATDDWGNGYMAPYNGTKAHVKAFSRALRTEMTLEGHDIEVIYLRVFSASTKTSKMPVNFMTLTPRSLASSALDRVGSGAACTVGSFRQAVILWLMANLQSSEMLAKMTSEGMKARMEEGEKDTQ